MVMATAFWPFFFVRLAGGMRTFSGCAAWLSPAERPVYGRSGAILRWVWLGPGAVVAQRRIPDHLALSVLRFSVRPGRALSAAGGANHVGTGYVVVPSSFLFVPADPEVSQEDHDFGDEFADDFSEGCPSNARRLPLCIDHHYSGHFAQGLTLESGEGHIVQGVCDVYEQAPR